MIEKEFLEKLGLNIKLERVRKRLTQEDLAGLVGCDRSYISLIERGLQNPSIIKIVKMSKALDVDIKVLLNELL
ncbi:MAG: hypothetical protein A2039_00140 [Candidatus Melainabacteria bacterium GWA2_34_9]|nr:MAG: hypothetical protein A2039_00140 [Candidatus Melainabacteria bacterium GWA2_34_9]